MNRFLIIGLLCLLGSPLCGGTSFTRAHTDFWPNLGISNGSLVYLDKLNNPQPLLMGNGRIYFGAQAAYYPHVENEVLAFYHHLQQTLPPKEWENFAARLPTDILSRIPFAAQPPAKKVEPAQPGIARPEENRAHDSPLQGGRAQANGERPLEAPLKNSYSAELPLWSVLKDDTLKPQLGEQIFFARVNREEAFSKMVEDRIQRSPEGACILALDVARTWKAGAMTEQTDATAFAHIRPEGQRFYSKKTGGVGKGFSAATWNTDKIHFDGKQLVSSGGQTLDIEAEARDCKTYEVWLVSGGHGGKFNTFSIRAYPVKNAASINAQQSLELYDSGKGLPATRKAPRIAVNAPWSSLPNEKQSPALGERQLRIPVARWNATVEAAVLRGWEKYDCMIDIGIDGEGNPTGPHLYQKSKGAWQQTHNASRAPLLQFHFDGRQVRLRHYDASYPLIQTVSFSGCSKVGVSKSNFNFDQGPGWIDLFDLENFESISAARPLKLVEPTEIAKVGWGQN